MANNYLSNLKLIMLNKVFQNKIWKWIRFESLLHAETA